MSARKKTSGGQAIVMVTLALMAMCGMMGLAVDLGWSFFVKKQAQAAADGAALAAVQEALKLNGGGAGVINCGVVDCVEPITPCSSFTTSASNLSDGCAYAARNGFTVGGLGGRQNVTIQANTTAPPPTAPGVNDIKYWVTVRTWQSIPQLFSSVLGNTEGAVSAIATAAIAGSIVPGSFYGMNHAGDCLTGLAGTAYPTGFDCGVDIDLTGTAKATNTCTNMDGSSSGVVAKLCAPAGIFLSSTCKGPGSVAGCTDPGSGSANFAGQTSNNPQVWSQGGTQISGDGWVGLNGAYDPNATNWLPHPPGVADSPATFNDPTSTLKQPPLVSAGQPLCPIPNGIMTSGTYGAYQYYASDAAGKLATGLPLTIGVNTQVTFDPKITTCPSGFGSSTPAATSFQTFTFWGGLSIAGNNNTSVNFGGSGGGQFVMAGTSSQTGTVLYADLTGTINGNSALGTQFLLTDGSYNGALTPPPGLGSGGIPLYQGYTDLKNAAGNLTGVTSAGTSAAPGLSGYENYLFWQDRNNSNDALNLTDGSCATPCPPNTAASHTNTSPQFVLEDGGLGLNLQGVFYQPRGAWAYLKSGGAKASGNVTLMMVTGALTCGITGCGNASVTLLGPAAPITVFITTLIQ